MINISINISGDNFETVDHNLNRLVERLSCVRRVETVLINSDTTLGAPTTQDAADEAAEVARGAADQATSTIEDVRAAAAEYVKTFGMDAAQADGGAILQAALGAPPAGEQIWKMSIIPAGMHGRVVAAFNEALAKNPFQRDVV